MRQSKHENGREQEMRSRSVSEPMVNEEDSEEERPADTRGKKEKHKQKERRDTTNSKKRKEQQKRTGGPFWSERESSEGKRSNMANKKGVVGSKETQRNGGNS